MKISLPIVMDCLEKELQYMLVIKNHDHDIYEKYLEYAISENNYRLVNNILEKIVIPDKALYWMALRRSSNIDLLKLLFTKRRQCDIFIE
ncbi:hypothetical protein NQ314_000772 [Rhamnusium bicolor]|uniref:Ankyrin repeat protein n=1 Tax=Rhamnusium bicolor TaxID=1586634 RepID=A0AAV8ZX19_9CUCU|nr:hypothetical protein NQ314_000772 [Rhamnusium bicolor]